MQEKNEIKEENFDDKLMLKKKEKQKELLQKYFEYDNGITFNLTNLKKEKQNFDKTFLENPNLDKIKNTPIFYISEILKEMNQKELESFDSLSTLLEKKEEINRLIELFLYPIKNLEHIQNNINNLNKIYEGIASNIIDDYIRVHYKEKGEKIVRNDKTSLEEKINEAKKMEKQIPLLLPNEYLKQIIKKMSELPELIGEKGDDKDKKILNEIKEEINSIMKDSESGEISKKWNFDDQQIKINKIWKEYYFEVITSKKIHLNDNTDVNEENKKRDTTNSVTLKEGDVDIILDQIMDKIHDLALYKKIEDAPKMRKLINKLLNINDNKEKPAEQITKEESEDLIKYLDKKENIRFFLYVLNKLRSSDKIPHKNEFEIIVSTFKKIADFFINCKDENSEDRFMMMAQTYCYLENDKKIYILGRIKEHELFKDMTLWEKDFKSKIDAPLKNLNIHDIEKEEQSLVEFFGMCLIQPATLMKEVGISEKDIKNLIKKFINKYPENTQASILTFIITSINSMNKNK